MRVVLGEQKRTWRSPLLLLPLMTLLTGCPQLLDDDFSTEPALTPDPLGSKLGSSEDPGSDSAATTSNGNGGASATDGSDQPTNEATSPTVNSGGNSTGNAGSAGAGAGGAVGVGGAGGANSTPDTGPDAAVQPPAVDISEDPVCAERNACPDGCAGFNSNGQTYVYCYDERGSTSAASQCEQLGMRLVWIESEVENQALVDNLILLFELRASDWTGRTGGGDALDTLFADQPQIWLGAGDGGNEGTWRWLDSGPEFWQGDDLGNPIDDAFNGWGSGEPNDRNNEDCAILWLDTTSVGNAGQWNDVSCSESNTFVCEMP